MRSVGVNVTALQGGAVRLVRSRRAEGGSRNMLALEFALSLSKSSITRLVSPRQILRFLDTARSFLDSTSSATTHEPVPDLLSRLLLDRHIQRMKFFEYAAA